MTTFGADLDGNGRFRARNRPYPATASSVFVTPLVCYLLANLVLEEDLCQRARIIVSKGWLDPSRKGMPSTSGLHHECEIFRVTAGKVQPPTKFVHRFMHQTIDSFAQDRQTWGSDRYLEVCAYRKVDPMFLVVERRARHLQSSRRPTKFSKCDRCTVTKAQ